MQFLLDADLPRSATAVFQSFGFDAINVRDIGMSSAPDTEVIQQAIARNRILVTADFDFADIRNYPPANYPGIVVLCLPKNATSSYIGQLLESFLQQTSIIAQLPGHLAIVEPGRIRLR